MKTDKGCKEMIASFKKKMKANDEAMKALEKNIEKLKKEIAQHREDLVNAEAQLKDDELYLKDMQVQCEDRANDYDQRSAMRGAELAAMTGALEVLTKDVKGRADDVNKRALLQMIAHAPHRASRGSIAVHANAPVAKAVSKSISFLQDSSSTA